MLKYLCSLLFLTSGFLNLAQAGTFTTLATEIDPTGYTAGVYGDVFCCYSSGNNQVVFSWAATGSPHNPWYCIYDVKTSSFSTLPTQIDSTGYTLGVYNDVFCCYNSVSDQVVFSWADNTSQNPWYCIYDVKTSSFSTPPTQIDYTGYTAQVNNDVLCCFNSKNNQIVFSWVQADYPLNPWYCIYDVQGASFSTQPTQIDQTGYTAGVGSDVFCCYNSLNNQIVFSWGGFGPREPWYCIYDATAGSFSTEPTLIDSSYSGSVCNHVFCCFSSTNNKVFFSWADNSSSQNPWYSIYNANIGSFSTSPTQISGYTGGVWDDVYCCYNSANNEVFLSWGDLSNNPWYSIYTVQGDSFSTTPAQIDSAYVGEATDDVYSCYNSTNNQIVFSWSGFLSNNPWYAIYTEPFPPGALQRVLSKYSPIKYLKGMP